MTVIDRRGRSGRRRTARLVDAIDGDETLRVLADARAP